MENKATARVFFFFLLYRPEGDVSVWEGDVDGREEADGRRFLFHHDSLRDLPDHLYAADEMGPLGAIWVNHLLQTVDTSEQSSEACQGTKPAKRKKKGILSILRNKIQKHTRGRNLERN